MDEKTELRHAPQDQDKGCPGSDKRMKNAEWVIHDEKIIQPTGGIPPGARFKGYRDVVIQDLIIRAHNTRYRLARWLMPNGEFVTASLPTELAAHRYGTTLRSYLLHQHHHCQLTQPLLLEQLREWGIDISSGAIDALLSAGHEDFHAQKAALHRRHVMPGVILHVTATEEARMIPDHFVSVHQHDALGVRAHRGNASGVAALHAVAIAVKVLKARRGDSARVYG